MNSRGCILLGTAIGAFVACVILTLQVTTTTPKIPSCPSCGSNSPLGEVVAPNATLYHCRCGENYVGAARSDFSWTGAAQWLLE